MSVPFKKHIFYRTRRALKSSQRRVMLAEAQNWKCCWCHCEMEIEQEKVGTPWPKTATVEHLIPYKYQGKLDVFHNLHSYNNLVACCYECNNKRGSALIWNGICIPELFEGF